MLRPIANVLTALRLAAVIPFAILLAAAGHNASWPAALVFAAAALTDFLDGYLARHTDRASRFGRIADPLADRLLINMALVLLWYEDRLPWWLAVPVLGRDVWLALLFRSRKMSTRVAVNMTGKRATAVIMLVARAADDHHGAVAAGRLRRGARAVVRRSRAIRPQTEGGMR